MLRSPTLQALLAVALFGLLRPLVFHASELSAASYFEPVLLAEALRRPEFLLLYGGATLALALCHRRTSWRAIDPGGTTRVFLLVAASILAWAFTTYDLNLYFDRAHLVDRLVMVVLLLGVAVHPSVFPLFLGHLLVVACQINHPLPMAEWMWADKRLVVDALVLFLVFLLSKAALGRRVTRESYAFLALGLVAATYSFAGFSKVLLGPAPWTWASENRLTNIFVASHLNGGWLGFLSREEVLAIADRLRFVERPLAIGTLGLELSTLALALHRRLARTILLGLVLLHLGILAASGIFFWKWIVFDLALLWYVRSLEGHPPQGEPPEPSGGPLFGRRRAATSLVLILGLPWTTRFVDYAWFDSRFTNYFVIQGIGATGAVYRLHPRFFAPYDILFQQSRFYYAVPGPVIGGTYGTTRDHDLMKVLENLGEAPPEEVRRRHGQTWYDAEATDRLAGFLTRYGRNAMRRGPDPLGPLRFIQPPFHFQSSRGPDAYAFQEEIVEMEVLFEERLYTGDEILLLRRESVLEVPLRGAGSSPRSQAR